MVIDDSNTIRRSAEIFLAQAGCQVVLAEDGFDALAKIADHHPDLIFVRHHDAAPRRLPDLRPDQEEPALRPRR
jgi:DNA-binding NtrC family response regulator